MTWPLSGYQKAWLGADLLAGVSVAAVALPIAIAYAELAGVPPVYGLYSSLLPLVAYALLGSSRQLILAPDAATCAVVAAVVAPLAAADMTRYISLTAALSIVVGVFCIACGFAGLGFLTNFLAQPILTGYLNGIAICIITGQLGALFGFKVESSGFFSMFWTFLTKLGATHLPTLAVGAAALALLLLLGRVAPSVPGPLVAVVLGIACSALFGFSQFGVKLLGAIPAGLPAFTIPSIETSDWQPLALGAIGLGLISYNSAMVTARGFAAKNRYDIDSNREFIALGAADIGSGILGGFAVSGADSRTAVNDSMGGKSQLTGLVAAAVLALTLIFLTGPLSWLPLAVLSAVLVKASLGLFDLRALIQLRRVSRREFRLCLIALLGVITVGVLPGVVVAVGVALVQLLMQASRPNDAVLGRIPGTDVFANIANEPDAEAIPGIIIYRFDSSLVFFNADHFRDRVKQVLSEQTTPPQCLILAAGAMTYVDTTGAAGLDRLYGDLDAKGIRMVIAEAKGQGRRMLNRTGFTSRIGKNRTFPTVAVAVSALTGDEPSSGSD